MNLKTKKMKTTLNINGLKKTALIVFGSFILFAGSVHAETSIFIPNANMMSLEAFFNKQVLSLKYTAPEQTEAIISAELYALESLVEATDELLKYTAPAEDETIETALELQELEVLFAASDTKLKYCLQENSNFENSINADVQLLMAETK
jgi:hypothetical protein